MMDGKKNDEYVFEPKVFDGLTIPESYGYMGPAYDFIKSAKFVSSPDDSARLYDYTGVEADRIAKPDRKTILSHGLPSYLPPVEIRRKDNYFIPAVKVGDDKYLLKGKDNDDKSFYLVTLDVYAALTAYHLEYDKALNKKIADASNAELAEKSDRIPRLKKPSVPSAVTDADIEDSMQPFDMSRYFSFALQGGFKPDRVSLKRSEVGRMRETLYYFISNFAPKKEDFIAERIKILKDSSPASQKALGIFERNFPFSVCKGILKDLHQKLLDLKFHYEAFESTWQKGRETSYGDSGLDGSLLEEFGVSVKRQNGDAINEKEIGQIRKSLEDVFSVYGNLADECRNFSLKISHAGVKRQHAAKAVGIFSPYFHAVGVSYKGDLEESGVLGGTMVMAHEMAHFLDHIQGQKSHHWFSSDAQGSPENGIAFFFRENMNPAKGEYWNETCECFARAMEEYSTIRMALDGRGGSSMEDVNAFFDESPAYMKPDEFLKSVAPKIDGLLRDYGYDKAGKEKDAARRAPNATVPQHAKSAPGRDLKRLAADFEAADKGKAVYVARSRNELELAMKRAFPQFPDISLAKSAADGCYFLRIGGRNATTHYVTEDGKGGWSFRAMPGEVRGILNSMEALARESVDGHDRS